jgi:hypothetical protein
MTTKRTVTPDLSQLDKFKEAAREIGADDNEARWDEQLKKIAKAKPAAEKQGGE